MNSITFHPLADLFPLIAGAEFDELVASIKANGLREEITIFDDAILDGRNRYRACGVAGVQPRFHTYTGDDPIAFVIDKNIHRRHLSPTQLGMIAARMTSLQHRGGDRRSESFNVAIATLKIPTVNQMADMMNIDRATVIRARTVLTQGTPEEIQAADENQASVHSIAKKIRSASKEERSNHLKVDRQEVRNNTKKIHSQIWGQIRDAVLNLTDLPNPAEVARIARYSDRAHMLDAKLGRALNYLKEFSDAWTAQGSSHSDAEAQSTDGDGDAGNGDRASGKKRSQPAA